jgi:regulator of sirC expression with transglutaminase-like and TPR domain
MDAFELTPDAGDRPERRELDALIDLLADEDEAVVRPVEARLAELGERARAALAASVDDSDARRRTRARRLLGALERREGLARLRVVASRALLDLERGLFTLAELAGSPAELSAAAAELDEWAAAVQGRLGEADAAEATGFDRPLTLVEVLAGEVGLRGATDDYHHPDNVHVHRVVARRRGLPLTLTAIYLFVARRVGLRAAPVALPGHVLLRLYAGNRSMLVDPFDGGAVRTRKECLGYLVNRGLAPRPDWFEDADDTTLFQRQLVNLANSHRLRGRATEAEELVEVAGLVARRRGLHPAADPESA